MTGPTEKQIEAWKAKAAVLRARGKNNTLHDIEQAADYLDAAALSAALAVEAGAEKPVAYRYRDFADGWILDHSEKSATEYAKQTGCAVQALWTYPPSLRQVVNALSDEQLRHIADSKDTGTCRSRILSALTTSPASSGVEGEAVAEASDLYRYCGADAYKWAEQFRLTALRLGYSDMDHGWLIGWFANAIEYSISVRHPAYPAPQTEGK